VRPNPRQCQVSRCSLVAVPNGVGLCLRHAVIGRCSVKGCKSLRRQPSSKCDYHKEGGVCFAEGCTRRATRRGGLCRTHGG
jgi:hypothetical protein